MGGKESLLGEHEARKWTSLLPCHVLPRQLGGDQGRRHPCATARGHQERADCRGAEDPNGKAENVNFSTIPGPTETQAHQDLRKTLATLPMYSDVLDEMIAT